MGLAFDVGHEHRARLFIRQFVQQGGESRALEIAVDIFAFVGLRRSGGGVTVAGALSPFACPVLVDEAIAYEGVYPGARRGLVRVEQAGPLHAVTMTSCTTFSAEPGSQP